MDSKLWLAGVLMCAGPAGAAPAAKTPAAKTPAPKTPAAGRKGPAAAKPRPPAPAPKPMAFKPAELDLAPGETFLVELSLPSPTGKAYQGRLTYTPGTGVTVKEDARFSGRIPPWGSKTHPRITAGREASGQVPVEAALEAGTKATLTVNVVPPAVEVIPAYRKLVVRVTNPFRERLLPGRVIVSNPDRFLGDITTREFKIPAGQTGEVEFPLPGYAPVNGELYEFKVRVESYHGFRSEKTHPLPFPEDPEPK